MLRSVAIASSLLPLFACNNETPIRARPAEQTLSQPPEPDNPEQLDQIVQVTEPAVDVLFVVDNSCSMDAEQTALANNFPTFMDSFTGSGLDYHIGVVSMDMWASSHRGRLRQAGGIRYIDRDVSNPTQVFSQMAVMGTGGDSEEKGRAAAYTAIEQLSGPGGFNEGFYRDDAALHFVFVSDEDDQSAANPVTRNEFGQWMQTLKESPDLVTAHAIAWLPNTNCPEGFEVGQTYATYVDWTDGVRFDICQSDWGPFLDELGLQTTGLKREFYLSHLPTLDPWTLSVSVEALNEDGQPVVFEFEECRASDEAPTCDVQYNPVRNSVSFREFVPPPLSTVQIRYLRLDGFSASDDVEQPGETD
jgi:hypothetical protein